MGPKKEELPAFTDAQAIAIANEFDKYEDYLDSKITPTDIFYLEDLELARQLVEMGYRSKAEVMSRQEFADFQEKAEAARIAAMTKLPKKQFGVGKDVSGYPFLLALQEREKPVREGKLSVSFILELLEVRKNRHAHDLQFHCILV